MSDGWGLKYNNWNSERSEGMRMGTFVLVTYKKEVHNIKLIRNWKFYNVTKRKDNLQPNITLNLKLTRME